MESQNITNSQSNTDKKSWWDHTPILQNIVYKAIKIT